MTNTKIKLNLDSLKSRKEWKRHKVKDGHNVYRILPPFGEASNGYPYRKWQIIWGFTDPESGRARPFADSMTTEKRSPVVEYVNDLKKRAETLGSKLKANGATDEEVKTRLKDLNDLIGNIIPKTVYIYNAADKAGEVGLLELKATAHKSMKEQMTKYIQDYNQDPTSLNSADNDSGVWFDVIRENLTGKFRDTTYKVEKVQAKVKDANGRVAFVDDRSPLSDAVVENYDNLAYDLSSIYQMKTYDELKEILDANMSRFIEVCPDADLSNEPGLAHPPAQSKLVANKPTGTGKVTTKIDDGDDDDQDAGTTPNLGATRPNGVASKAATSAEDDDFMTKADRLLQS